jgi:hypothetical protein
MPASSSAQPPALQRPAESRRPVDVRLAHAKWWNPRWSTLTKKKVRALKDEYGTLGENLAEDLAWCALVAEFTFACLGGSMVGAPARRAVPNGKGVMMVAALESPKPQRCDDGVTKQSQTHKGFHGVPLPYLRTLLDDGLLTPWPNSTKSSDNLGLCWWGRDVEFAKTYGGPVEIGDGWMVTCAVATTSAGKYLGPNQAGGRVKSYGSKEVVLSGDVFIEVSHVTSLGEGDGRYLPEWHAFPWEEFKQWRHAHTQALAPLAATQAVAPLAATSRAPNKVAKVARSCPRVEPSWLHVGVSLSGPTRWHYNADVAKITLVAHLQAAEFRNEVEVYAAGATFLMDFESGGPLPMSRAFAVLWVAGGEKQRDGTTKDYPFIKYAEKSKHVRRLFQWPVNHNKAEAWMASIATELTALFVDGVPLVVACQKGANRTMLALLVWLACYARLPGMIPAALGAMQYLRGTLAGRTLSG